MKEGPTALGAFLFGNYDGGLYANGQRGHNADEPITEPKKNGVTVLRDEKDLNKDTLDHHPNDYAAGAEPKVDWVLGAGGALGSEIIRQPERKPTAQLRRH